MTREQENTVREVGLQVQGAGGTYVSRSVGRGSHHNAVVLTITFPDGKDQYLSKDVLILPNGERL